jgi:hypothetical protein
MDKTEIYESFEPRLNSGEVRLLDLPELTEQLLTLVIKGTRIDHEPGGHDDCSNAAAGSIGLASGSNRRQGMIFASVGLNDGSGGVWRAADYGTDRQVDLTTIADDDDDDQQPITPPTPPPQKKFTPNAVPTGIPGVFNT